MVDPWNITDYNRSPAELEELLLFCVSVAGKSAGMAAAALDEFLAGQPGKSPFDKIRRLIKGGKLPQAIRRLIKGGKLPQAIRASRLGKHTRLTRAFAEIVQAGLDLTACTPEQLEAIHGIGPKTSRFFIVHTRAGEQLAVLDTHILRYMRSLGYENIPASTPTGKRYLQIEQDFIALARREGRDIAEFDLWIWRQYARPAATPAK